jgi:L-ascorbate metabolism protein UlaG (beta-lactamase superfamily)
MALAPPFPKHFDGRRFYNPAAAQARGWLDFFRWKLSSRPEPAPPFIADVVPFVPPPRIDHPGLHVTVVNHSTVLLQQNGINILTDPVWSDRASPFRWIGPRRRRAPGIRAADLPPIDIVLISHNHYDHLDLATLRSLAGRFAPAFVVPLGLARLLRSIRIQPACELDWGQSWTSGDTTIHCVPAFHFSSRGIFDRNQTLWCGYVIESRGRTVYFAADTGFGPHFGWIRERFGPPRLALLPIGAYLPLWFMAPIHMSPPEAIQAHKILDAQTSIAIHHGTFQLGDDAVDTPRREFLASSPPDSFLILENGQSTAII